MLIIFYYIHGALPWPLMFSALEIMVSLRLSTLLLIMGVSFYYEVKVVFERFASVFNIEPRQMIRIHPESKKPLEG